MFTVSTRRRWRRRWLLLPFEAGTYFFSFSLSLRKHDLGTRWTFFFSVILTENACVKNYVWWELGVFSRSIDATANLSCIRDCKASRDLLRSFFLSCISCLLSITNGTWANSSRTINKNHTWRSNKNSIDAMKNCSRWTWTTSVQDR